MLSRITTTGLGIAGGLFVATMLMIVFRQRCPRVGVSRGLEKALTALGEASDTLLMTMSEESALQRLIELQRKLLPIRWDIDELRERMKLVESQTMVSVAEARDERGSPLYSTQEVRRAAVTAKLAESEEYSSLQERRRALQREADVLALDIKELSTELGMFPPY